MVRLTLSAHAGCHLGAQWDATTWRTQQPLPLRVSCRAYGSCGLPTFIAEDPIYSICQHGPQRPAPQKTLEAVATEVTNSHSHCRLTRETQMLLSCGLERAATVLPKDLGYSTCQPGHALHPRAAAAAGGLTSWVHTPSPLGGQLFFRS